MNHGYNYSLSRKLDIYKKYIQQDASDKKIVFIGRVIIVLSLLIAIVINWKDTLGIGGKGGFEFIQKYTGYISPAIFPVFLLGFFWKKATSKAAIIGIFFGLMLSIIFDKFLPGWMGNDTFIYTAYPTASGSFEIPYLIQMGWVFFFTTLAIVLVSLLDVKGQKHENEITEDKGQFTLSKAHLAMVVLVLGVVIALYIKFW